MKVHRLKRQQEINTTIENAWAFFSSPYTLDKLTPEEMDFKITGGDDTDRMFEGQIIEYTVRPIMRIPLRWVTRITDVAEGQSFIDEQVEGPYRLWKHQHIFTEKNGSVLMTDIVDYALPFGVIGNAVHRLFIKKKLDSIFDYRCRKTEALFN